VAATALMGNVMGFSSPTTFRSSSSSVSAATSCHKMVAQSQDASTTTTTGPRKRTKAVCIINPYKCRDGSCNL